jgi:hypothetical protein
MTIWTRHSGRNIAVLAAIAWIPTACNAQAPEPDETSGAQDERAHLARPLVPAASPEPAAIARRENAVAFTGPCSDLTARYPDMCPAWARFYSCRPGQTLPGGRVRQRDCAPTGASRPIWADDSWECCQ